MLNNEELYNLLRSPNLLWVIKSRRLILAGHVARMEEGRSTLKMLSGTPARKRRLRCRWEDNVRMYLKEIAINTRKWLDWAQDRDYWRALVNAALNLQFL